MVSGGGSSGGAGEQEASSNPTQNSPIPREDSPPRRHPTSAAENAPPPIMGVPGQSAFMPYTKPPPPPPPPPPSPIPPHFTAPSGGGYGLLHGGHAVPVGGAGYSGTAPAAPRAVGSPSARKRGRDGGAAAAGRGGGGNNNNNPVNCSVCGKAFMTPKALFGHMRSHPDRGWKGAHPPPAFRAEEEFADLGALIRPEAPSGSGAVAEGAREEEEEVAAGGDNYRLPDLNNPPPEDAN